MTHLDPRGGPKHRSAPAWAAPPVWHMHGIAQRLTYARQTLRCMLKPLLSDHMVISSMPHVHSPCGFLPRIFPVFTPTQLVPVNSGKRK
jgi:hypothetical protein